MEKKVRIGVLGGVRGTSMINYCIKANNAEVVAICDKLEEVLQKQKAQHKDLDIAYYTDFEEFIKHDMDAVVLANYATEHAPFAIKAMQAGKHVFSEVSPVQTMKEAVELIEAVEETGMIYDYGENYCYMGAPYEMRRLYREGALGEFEYGECEYVHNCERAWHRLTYGDKDHWRNNICSTFYCTHSLGPVLHITGLRPVSVIGIEGGKCGRNLGVGAKNGQFAMELVTLENGGIVKSLHGGLYKDSIWYSIYGSKGRMESARMDAQKDYFSRIYINTDPYPGAYEKKDVETYLPLAGKEEEFEGLGHGGSDYYSVWHFVEKILGNPEADIIDVYEAMDMFLPGLFAYRSILQGGIPMEIPDLRNKEQREKWRNDTACTDPKVAGDQLQPTMASGTPEIPDEIYAMVHRKWLEKQKEKNDKEIDPTLDVETK